MGKFNWKRWILDSTLNLRPECHHDMRHFKIPWMRRSQKAVEMFKWRRLAMSLLPTWKSKYIGAKLKKWAQFKPRIPRFSPKLIPEILSEESGQPWWNGEPALAAAAVEHRGFLSEVGHELAMQYNDRSPLENMFGAPSGLAFFFIQKLWETPTKKYKYVEAFRTCDSWLYVQ